MNEQIKQLVKEAIEASEEHIFVLESLRDDTEVLALSLNTSNQSPDLKEINFLVKKTDAQIQNSKQSIAALERVLEEDTAS